MVFICSFFRLTLPSGSNIAGLSVCLSVRPYGTDGQTDTETSYIRSTRKSQPKKATNKNDRTLVCLSVHKKFFWFERNLACS